MLKQLLSIAFPLGLLLVSWTNFTEIATPQENYKNYCAGCHGVEMEAFVDRKWKHGNAKDDLIKAIKVGYADEGMPAFDTTFTDQEIAALADYILGGIQGREAFDFQEKFNPDQVFTSEELSYKVELVADGFNSPWGMAFLPNGGMLITDKEGKLYYLNTKGKRTEITGGPDVLYQGQGGLMDVELDPDFKNNRVIYLSYSAHKEENGETLATTAIMRAKIKGRELTEQKIIFEALPYSRTRHHYGSKLEFDKDGYLFFSVGDRGNRDRNPQNLDNHCGKIHRINPDGSIPEDNPFYNTEGAMKSIYSFGHRNPQGVCMDPETGVIWTSEHGPRGGDEVNRIQKSKNYGWPVISYGINYNGTTFTDKTEQDGMLQPEVYWIPSIAPCGMTFVKGDKYPAWKGDLLVGSLRFEYLNRCKVENGKIVSQEPLLKNIGRIRDVEVGPDGYIYVSVERPGKIYRIVPQ